MLARRRLRNQGGKEALWSTVIQNNVIACSHTQTSINLFEIFIQKLFLLVIRCTNSWSSPIAFDHQYKKKMGK